MANGHRVAKMFGVLVLGAGAIVQASEPTTPEASAKSGPGEQPTTMPTTQPQTKEPAKQPTTMPAAKPPEHCQLEFTFNRYDRERVQSIKTCLDGKSDEEIMKIINDAKNQTCASPFCGCWLG